MGSPLVIPVFIPHSGCPHRCAFCNQAAITGVTPSLPEARTVSRIIQDYLTFKGQRSHVEVGFFGGNFLGLSPRYIDRLLSAVTPFLDTGQVQGIRFSTRPDTVTTGRIDLLRSYPVCLVELGVQSMNDRVLAGVKRGHTASDTVRAMARLQQCGIPAGVQVMVGLPGESTRSMIQGAEELISAGARTVRIYPLLVFKGTLLYQWFSCGTYQPMTLASAVTMTRRLYDLFSGERVRVIRMGLQASGINMAHLAAGPWHPAFGHLVLSDVMRTSVTAQLQSLPDISSDLRRIWLRVHPRSESRMRGDRNQTLKRLSRTYPGCEFTIVKDLSMVPGRVKVATSPP